MLENLEIQEKLPKAEDVLSNLPLTPKRAETVQRTRQETKDIIKGQSTKKILIFGPCSAWSKNAVIDYFGRMEEILKGTEDKILRIARVYTQKPRTTIGWTGPINQPVLDKEPDIAEGIQYCRKMMLDVIDLGYGIADEALFTHNEGYFLDLLSWVAIGARSTEDAEHRQVASAMDIPVGLKNTTAGEIEKGINSVRSAQNPHVFPYQGYQVRSLGNPYAHLVLRGGNLKSREGNVITGPNNKEVERTLNSMIQQNLNPAIIVDCSHDNTIDKRTGRKDYIRQHCIIDDVLMLMSSSERVRSGVKGFMIESFIEDGNQSENTPVKELEYGKSITDPCMGIEKTKKFIETLYKGL